MDVASHFDKSNASHPPSRSVGGLLSETRKIESHMRQDLNMQIFAFLHFSIFPRDWFQYIYFLLNLSRKK